MTTWRTQVQTNYPGGGGPGYSTFTFRDSGPITAAPNDLQAATTALREFYDGVTQYLWGSTVGTDGVWSPISDPTVLPIDVEGWTLTLGTEASLPPFCSILVGWRTDTAGPSGRGRTFLGPISRTAADAAGAVSDAARIAVRSSATAELVTPFAGNSNGAFAIHSRRRNLTSDITRVEVGPAFASLTTRRD